MGGSDFLCQRCLRAGLMAVALLVPAVASDAAQRLSVGEIPNARRDHIKTAREHFSFPADFNRDGADAVVGFESEACLMQNVASNTFVSNAPGERRCHEKLAPSTRRLLGSAIAKPGMFQGPLISFVLGVYFGFNVFDAVGEGCGIANAVYRLSLTRQYGIAVFGKQPLILSWLRLAKPACSIRIKSIQIPDYQGSFYEYSGSGRPSQVSQPISCKGYNSGADWKLLDLRDRQIVNQQPSPLSGFHLAQLSLHSLGLSLHGVCLTRGLARQARQVTNRVLEIGRVSSVFVGEIGDCKRSQTDKEREPLIDSKATKEAAGIAFAVLATILGTLGCVLMMGAVDGKAFGLVWKSRVSFTLYAIVLCGVAFFVLDQLAAPLLKRF